MARYLPPILVFAALVSLACATITPNMLHSTLSPEYMHLKPKAKPTATPYNETEALTYAYFSGIAYCDEATILNWTCIPCSMETGTKVVSFLYDKNLNVAGYVAEHQGQAMVAFRGTLPNSWADWLDDLKIATAVPLGNCPGCEVHSGFYAAYLSLRCQMIAALNKIDARNVIITGHSLGAALSCIAAYDLSTVYDVITYYTYGQPRVGNREFSDYFGSILTEYRVVHYADIVPHLPPEILGYYHVPREVWYNEDQTQYVICDDSGEDSQCSDSLTFPDSITDHRNYLGIPISYLCPDGRRLLD